MQGHKCKKRVSIGQNVQDNTNVLEDKVEDGITTCVSVLHGVEGMHDKLIIVTSQDWPPITLKGLRLHQRD
ncbi:hypothetical protein YC2023_012260 [Brassica napus]